MSCRDELGNTCNHKIRLHFKSIGMPRVPEFTALENAQKVYGPHAIAIEFASGESLLLNVFQRISLADVDAGTCRIGASGPITGEQQSLFSLGSYAQVGARDIVVYYVDQLTKTNGSRLAGCSSHAPNRPAVVVAAAGSPWTLAHELAHVLGLRHVRDATNVMHTPTSSITANPPTFTASQLTTLRASPLAVSC